MTKAEEPCVFRFLLRDYDNFCYGAHGKLINHAKKVMFVQKRFPADFAWKGKHHFTFHDYSTKIFDVSQVGGD